MSSLISFALVGMVIAIVVLAVAIYATNGVAIAPVGRQRATLATTVLIGAALGAAFGVVLDNIALGIGTGVAVGIAIGVARDKNIE